MQNNLEFIEVEVAYAKNNIAQGQLLLKLKLNNQLNTMTIKEIITLSKILEIFPEINLQINKVGIFGKIKDLNTTNIKNGDRIEIYRPLLQNPNKTRISGINSK